MTSNVFRENDGMHFTNPSVGDVIPFTHPITGTEHKLTVQDFELQELSARGSRVDDVVQRKADERHRNLIINMIVESLGVSRQAVSKWESGASDLSTTHLIVLSKLFGASTEELLKRAQ